VKKFLSAGELDRIFELKQYFRNVDYIFTRVFGKA